MTQRKTAVLNVRIRPDIKDTLKSAATRETRSIANMIEVMVVAYANRLRTKDDQIQPKRKIASKMK